MIALAINKTQRVWGRNRLDRNASTLTDSYKPLAGIHAELDCWRQNRRMKGGTIYIGGVRNGTVMPNTRPCPPCVAIISEMGIRWAVFNVEGEPIKMLVRDMVKEI